MTAWLRPFAEVYGAVTRLRNYLYDQKLLNIHKANRPVVSIGNLTTGGTGKTPMIDYLINHCLEMGLTPGVVSRGYRGDFEGVQKVRVDSAINFGDEPMMLAKKHPNVPIFVGPDRVAATEALLAHQKVSVVLADDAFQHRRLHRDIDIVLIDSTQPLSVYNLLPMGRAREAVNKALSRAQFVVLNKTNLSEDLQVILVKEWMKRSLVESKSKALMVEATFEMRDISQVNDSNHNLKPRVGEPVLLISGIARPEGFSKLVKENGFEVSDHATFADHHSFLSSDLEPLFNKWPKHLPILVTEKDAIKLVKINHPLVDRMWSVEMSLNLKGAEGEKLNEAIRRLSR